MSMSTDLIIADVTILQDVHGRYSLNTLHQASGENANKRPGNWMNRKSTQALIAHVQNTLGLPYPIIAVMRGGDAAGTFAHTIIADAYQQWLRSPKITRSNADAGYVYVIQFNDDFPVKIGYSVNPLRRLEILQISSPVPLIFRHLWHTEKARALEQSLHKTFASFRVYGEWFQLGIDEEKMLLAMMEETRGVIATTLPGGVMRHDKEAKKLWSVPQGRQRQVNAYLPDRVDVLDSAIASVLGPPRLQAVATTVS